MSKATLAWCWLALLIVLDIVVPWYVLSSVPKMSGAFLFWTLWIIAVVMSAFVVVSSWREVKP